MHQLLVSNGGIDPGHCEGPAFEALCSAERRRHGASDDTELARILRGDEAALHAFVAQIAVPETWFFRYPASFEALRAHLSGRTRPVRIASIGCATGQEAYAAAATAFAAMRPEAGVVVEAFDRNPAAIDVARRGEWSGSMALRGSAPAWAEPWLRLDAHGAWLHPSVRAAVSCSQVHSIGGLIEALAGRSFDVVLCRNVLIYLDGATRERLVRTITQSIPVGGLLMLGHAERVELGTEWSRDGRPESFSWHRGELPALVQQEPARAVGATTAWTAAPAPRMGRRERTAATMAGAADPSTATGAEAGDAPGGLRGQVDAIFARAEAALAAGEDAHAHTLLEQVVYLAPQHDLAMLALASVCDRLGRSDDAARWQARAKRAASHGGGER
ncbi:MAG: CheR family methyltransferase [Phycisphaerales bacterium]